MLRLLAFIIVATTGTSWPEHALEPADLARACDRRDQARAEAREKLEREMDAAIAKAAADTDAQLHIRHDGDLVLQTADISDRAMRLMVECIDEAPRDAGPMTILADNHGKLMQCWPEPK